MKTTARKLAGACLALTTVGCLSACSVFSFFSPKEGDRAANVRARVETVRVAGSGDAADDPAIWVAPDPARSLILGTDTATGLYVFGLDGGVRQFLPAGRLNNVDLRDGFAWGNDERVLVVATDRTNTALAVFLLDPATGQVAAAPGGRVPLDLGEPYGVCLTRTPEGIFMAAATGTEGEVRQLTLQAEAGGVVWRLVRRLELGSIAEGCVFDDRTGDLYIAEEEVGIWRLPADPAEGDVPVLVHPVDNDALVADVEGLAIYPEGAEGGWLVASSQGDSAFTLFALPEGRYVGRIRVRGGRGVDRVSETDGLEVTARPLPGYPRGLLVVQDGADDDGGRNFKLVDWAQVWAVLRLE